MDIQQIANEYSRLIGMRFVLGLEDGTVINLAFTMKDFYHLLGFEKFEDASIIKMIENNAFYKEKFFKAVKNGKITFTETKLRLKNADRYYVDGKWNELCDSENLQNASLVINNRFPYFSYENIKMLLQEELVALYNTDLAPDWRKISADKLFFHLMLKENKNLNLFIRNIDEGKKDCPVSFFLEQIKDEYLKTKNGCEEALQKRIKITFRGIYTNGTKISEYSPFWDKIRFYYSKNNIPELYVAQRKIQEYFVQIATFSGR